MPIRVIVDEDAGLGTKVWEEFSRVWTRGDHEAAYVFLKDAHPGIPDVEILDKLLTPHTILVTGDRVLHMRALERGFRSYTLNERGQLTRRPLRGVRVSELPASAHRHLQDDYRHRPATDLSHTLKAGLSDKQFQRYRTARRRIRSYFGSAAAIGHASVTIGSKLAGQGLLCGFVLRLAGTSGVAGLRATEGYCRPANGRTDPACAVIHALREQYLLQLEQVPTELFIVSPPALKLCRGLLGGDASAEPLHRLLRDVLAGISRLTLRPCTKGPFFDAMNKKLDQLDRSHSNEITAIDFAELIA